MKTLQELCAVYCSDKGSDKSTSHSYADVYATLFEPFRNRPVTVLEVGIKSGASIKMWHEYFYPGSQIIGVDTHSQKYQINLDYPEIHCGWGSSTDAAFMAQFKDIDIFIDDGSHYINDQMETMRIALPKMNKGGCYVTEDIGQPENSMSGAEEAMRRFRELNIPNGAVLDLRGSRPDCLCNILYVISPCG